MTRQGGYNKHDEAFKNYVYLAPLFTVNRVNRNASFLLHRGNYV